MGSCSWTIHISSPRQGGGRRPGPATRRIETAYDSAGRPYLFTSFDAPIGGNVVSQIQRQFNGLGQLTAEYQEHGGPVSLATTPKVSYTYSEMSGNNNHSRLTRLTYPNGRELVFHYNGLDGQVSRLTSISDSSGTLERYEYLGLGTVVERRHPDTGVRLSYIKRNSEPVGDAGDQYTGLDRFGRVVDQRWRKGNNDVDRYRYGYDRDSNRLFKENVLDAVFSELYHQSGPTEGYDPLNQLTGFERGALSDTDFDGIFDTVASPSREQSWELDALGNWSSLTTNGSTETRTHNLQNEVTQVGANALTFDANGNTTTDDTGRQLIYDAWNRLVEVKDSGGATIVRYAYDALNRRVSETKAGVTRDFYYSDQWQVLEERVNGQAQVQYVWSPVYVDAMIRRDRDTDNNGSLEERLYVLQDANWNVTALVNPAGQVVERYVYDPYGQATVLAPNWTNRPASLYSWQHLHQGGRYDADVGLYHFRNRHYSPTLGRWVQIDPIEYMAGDTNLYSYVFNNPVCNLDPSGERAFLWFMCTISINRVPVAVATETLNCFGCTQAAASAAAPGCNLPTTCCYPFICQISNRFPVPMVFPPVTPYKVCLIRCIVAAAGCRFCI